MKTYILITALLLLLVTEYSQGCTPNGHESYRKRRSAEPTAPEVNKVRSRFFRECSDLVRAAKGILQLPTAVDYVIRDTNWYNNVKSNLCKNDRDVASCWIFALEFLLDRNSPFFEATAKCICEWADNCWDPPSDSHSPSRKKREIRNERRCPPPYREKRMRPGGPNEKELSKCIESQSRKYIKQYPSLKGYDGKSVTTLLTDHYTHCRTIADIPYEERNLFNLLYKDRVCPTTGPKALWRTNITTLYDVATRNDGPIGAAFLDCKDDPCEPNPCKNQGICVQIYSKTGKENYNCVCQEGYTGKHCETETKCKDENADYCRKAFKKNRRICSKYGFDWYCQRTCNKC